MSADKEVDPAGTTGPAIPYKEEQAGDSLLGQTQVELFRAGNATSPRMDHVRDRDVSVSVDPNGATWVLAGTGGISTFSARGMSGSNWWRLHRGYEYGPLLLVWNDHGQHWQWEPVRDMLLVEFKAQLAASHGFFQRA